MQKRLFYLVSVVAVVLSATQATAQAGGASADKDPYRYFLGNWSGVELVTPSSTHRTIALHVTEDQESGRMRWDYWFEVKDQKKYRPATRWFLLKPAKHRMQTYWEGSCSLIQSQRNCDVSDFKTVGLDAFSEQGLGKFYGEDGPNRFTVDLQKTTLVYMSEFDDGKRSKILSKYAFRRISSGSDADVSGTVLKPSNQE
jgi:hypothetical protein